jgi:hypothetical protein
VIRKLAILVCAAPLLLAVGSCGKTTTLETNEQALGFLVKVAGGESPGKWKLVDGAGALALAVWAHQDEIARLGQKLRQTPGWACKAATWVQRAKKFQNGIHTELSDADRASIKLDSKLGPYGWEEVDELIDDMLALAPLEAAETVNAVCALRQF